MKIRAFTLIELLVVIAIIAILAAILFPVFAQAKAAAKKTQCISNVKQLSISQMLYKHDYDDTYAPPFCGPIPGPDYINDNLTWDRLIQPYLKDFKVLACPADQYSPQTTTRWGVIRRSYTMPSNMGWLWWDEDRANPYGYTYGVNESSLPFVSITVVFYERDNCNPDGGQWDWCAVGDGSNEFAHRHNKHAVIGYADGHAKSVYGDPDAPHYAILPGYRCWPYFNSSDSADMNSRWSGNWHDILPQHEGLDVTCGGKEGNWP